VQGRTTTTTTNRRTYFTFALLILDIFTMVHTWVTITTVEDHRIKEAKKEVGGV
jgi:hypothetical protein